MLNDHKYYTFFYNFLSVVLILDLHPSVIGTKTDVDQMQSVRVPIPRNRRYKSKNSK